MKQYNGVINGGMISVHVVLPDLLLLVRQATAKIRSYLSGEGANGCVVSGSRLLGQAARRIASRPLK